MNTNTHLPCQHLPESLRRIADYCGWDTMWAIWGAYAGDRLFVPQKLDDSHPLCTLLGFKAAQQLCSVFAGELLFIAKADSAKRAIRDQAIRADKADGVAMGVLCQRYNLTYRQIQTICRQDQHDMSYNFDLFIDLNPQDKP